MMALDRLIAFPPAAIFDKSPVQALAFRLSHPSGASWAVAGGVFSASAGALSVSHNLSALTVAQLATALTADGFTVTDVSADLAGLSGLVLLDSAGGYLVSNGDRIFGFTSMLWVLMSALGLELDAAADQIVQALRQMIIGTSEGQWLDLWGQLYAEGRLAGDTDASYAARIPQEAFRLRVNPRAIEKAIFDLTGWDVRIEEPWQEIFTLDQSALSSYDKLYDGDLVGYHLIRPVANQAVDWNRVFQIINRNRAAGVLISVAESFRALGVDAALNPSVDAAVSVTNMSLTRYEDRPLLDFSAIEDLAILNDDYQLGRDIIRSFESLAPSPDYSVDYVVIEGFRTYGFLITYTEDDWDTRSTWSNVGEAWNGTPPDNDFQWTRSS